MMITNDKELAQKKLSVKKLLMPSALVGIITLLLLFIAASHFLYTKSKEQELSLRHTAVVQQYQSTIVDQQFALSIPLELIADDPETLKALENGDADALLNIYQDSFNEMKARYKITHLYFIDKKRHAIMRVHNPKVKNDEIKRFTLYEAEKTKELVGGIDIGPLGTYTLRVVKPVFIDEKLIGYIEMGKEIEDVIKQLSTSYKIDMVFLLKKDSVLQHKWTQGMKKLGRAYNWDNYLEYVEIFSSLPWFNGAVAQGLIDDFNKNKAGFNQSFTSISHGDSTYNISSFSVLDSIGTKMGDVFIFQDTAQIQQKYMQLLLFVSLLSILIIAICMLIAKRQLGKADLFISNIFQEITKQDLVFKKIFQASQTGFIISNPNSASPLKANSAALSIFQLEQAEDFKLGALQAVENIASLNVTWVPTNPDVKLMSFIKDNSKHFCEFETIIIDPKEEVLCYAVHDVTEVFKLQQDKNKQLGRLQSIINNMPCMVSLKDHNNNFVLFNKSFAEAFGIDPINSKNSFLENNTKRLLERIKKTDEQVFKTKAPLSYELSLPNRDKTEHNYLVNKLLITENDGAKYLLSVSTDITERIHIEKQLIELRVKAEEASQAKSDFLARMTHEIRTPMNAIVGLNHLAIQAKPSDKVLDYLQKVNDATQNLLSITNDILDFSKMESNHLEINEKPFLVQDVIDEVYSVALPIAVTKKIELNLNIQNTEPLIGDPLRIRQVLQNLTNNALKFTETGNVTISCLVLNETEDDMTIRLSIEDTGIGIAAKDVPRLFTGSFHQVDGSITRKYGGTGLGLSICKKLIDLMNGTISVQSLPGLGSIFFVVLTLKKAKNQQAAQDLDSNIKTSPAESLSENSEIKTSASPSESANLATSAVKDANLTEPVIGVLKGQAITNEPVLVKEALGAIAMPAQAKPETSRKPSVLIVEDNEINKEIALELLSDFDVTLATAENGLEALESVRKNQYDLIFMDLQMPIMDGLTATKNIRALEDCSKEQLPIIALTANSMLEDRKRCDEVGMNDFISKPIDFKDLESKFTKWIAVSKEQKKLQNKK